MPKLAIVRVRGLVRLSHKTKDTMDLMGLTQKQACIIVEDTPQLRGMLQRSSQYLTWGEVDEETEKVLTKHTSEKTIRLAPPRGGYERKGIKTPYSKGGAIGYRGKDINQLIIRMLPRGTP